MPDSTPQRRAARWIGALVATALLVSALAFVATRWDEVVTSVSEARDHPWTARDTWLAAALLGLAALNVAFSGAFYRLLMSRFGRVGLLEMQAVVASATLINYLPLRPGLFARVAYHKRVNAIDVRHSARVVIEAIAIGLGATAYLLAAVALAHRLDTPPWAWIAAPLPALALLAVWRPARVLAVAGCVRYVEVLIWAGRLAIAYALLGVEITPLAAMACAATVIVTTLVPFVSNGLGLTEWSMGLLAPLVGADAAIGVVAQLVNRAGEMLVVTALGVPAFIWISRRMTAGRRP